LSDLRAMGMTSKAVPSVRAFQLADDVPDLTEAQDLTPPAWMLPPALGLNNVYRGA
jgi:hypothetical protein